MANITNINVPKTYYRDSYFPATTRQFTFSEDGTTYSSWVNIEDIEGNTMAAASTNIDELTTLAGGSLYGYNFSVYPSDTDKTFSGVEVKITARIKSAPSLDNVRLSIRLAKDSTVDFAFSSGKSVDMSYEWQTFTVGGVEDLWSYSLLEEDLFETNFGVAVSANKSTSPVPTIYEVRSVELVVYTFNYKTPLTNRQANNSAIINSTTATSNVTNL